MTAEIIKFKSRQPLKPVPKSQTDMLWEGSRRPYFPKRRLGGVKSRVALKKLSAQAETFECCMLWLRQMAEAAPDPRAIAGLMDKFRDWAVFKEPVEVDRVIAFILAVLAERRKRFPPPKPTFVP